jgi:hypothetical protein
VGQLVFFARILSWHVAGQNLCLRIKWWGEEGRGCVIRGDGGSCRYPVRSEKPDLLQYFSDMGSLVVDILHESTMTRCGRAYVPMHDMQDAKFEVYVV